MDPSRWFEAHFHHVRPRVIAALSRRFGDLDIAEDAFATACMKAITSWPDHGRPDEPVAWLIRAGSNAVLDTKRREATAGKYRDSVITDIDEGRQIDTDKLNIDSDELRDDVLRLLFVCCHRDLSVENQLALALKVVAGMRVAEIAAAFLVKEKAMERRITRAKKVVRDAAVPFETPSPAERLQRLKSVSLMLYLLFNEGWYASAGETALKQPLCEEAIRLARELLHLFPAISELMGLLALMLFHYAKRKARLDNKQQLLSLDEQNRQLWDRAQIGEAQSLMQKAQRHRTPSPYQIQAAIAAVHAGAAHSRDTDWAEIRRLYDALLGFEPSPVIALNRAVATSRIDGPAVALLELDTLAAQLVDYRWFHSFTAGLLSELSKPAEAIAAFDRALALGPTEPERQHMLGKIEELKKMR